MKVTGSVYTFNGINMYVEEDRSVSSVLSGFPWGNLSLAASEVMCEEFGSPWVCCS